MNQIIKKRKRLIFIASKGNAVFDTILIMVVVFLVALISFAGIRIYNEVNTDFQLDPDMSAESKTMMSTGLTQYPLMMDNAIATIFILLWIAALIFSFLIRTHPVMFVFTLILLIFVIIVSGMLSNSFMEVVDDTEFSSYQSSFPITIFILSHYIEFITVVALSISLVLFTRFT